MSNRSITGYHLNTFTIRISRRFLSAQEFQMGNLQKYWSQNVGQDFIVLDFFVGSRSCGRKRCVREINVSRAWNPVHAGDKALTRETPAKRGGVNRYVKGRKNLEIVEMKPNIKNLNDIQREIRKAYWKYIDNSLTTRQWPNEWKTKLYEKILDFYKTQKIRWKTNTTS